MSLITLTFGDAAENHKGMEQIGHRLEEGQGFELSDLESAKENLERRGATCEIVQLRCVEEEEYEVPQAYVLVIKNGVNCLLNDFTQDQMFEEQKGLMYDKQAFMYGRVVNKHARWNLCFADEDQEPSYADGKGRIVSYRHIPLTQKIRETISEWMGDEMLNGEANYYYDISKCGISYHGDSERHKVFAVRMGESMPIYFQWFQKSKPVGERIKIDLDDGDMYIMSEKAVGTDWMKKIVPTLRHATGCDKFTVIKA
jgi:hypothetical protein